MTKLKRILAKRSGRSSTGRVTVRHQGGREKRFLRFIDYKRDKREIWSQVEAIEYDPNRNARLALLVYEDGERKYIICPNNLKVGDKIIASVEAPIKPGNALPLSKIPAGTQIHNIEINPGKGGQIVRGAGSVAVIQGKEERFVLVKMPSGELRRFVENAWATVGQVGNPEFNMERIGKAGRKRHMGIRPTVRGIAMHPNAHPHGGGEGRSGIGLKYPKRPSGRPAVGKTRSKKKYSDYLIVSERKRGKHH